MDACRRVPATVTQRVERDGCCPVWVAKCCQQHRRKEIHGHNLQQSIAWAHTPAAGGSLARWAKMRGRTHALHKSGVLVRLQHLSLGSQRFSSQLQAAQAGGVACSV